MSDINQNNRPGHSTGPRSSSGRETSSRNAASHGLSCEKFFLLPDEKQEDFDALAETLAEEYKDVASPGLAPLLKNLVEALWLQNRAYRKICQTESAIFFLEQNREFEELDKTFKRLLLMQRYKTSYENSYQRAFRAIESFRKSRIAEFVARVRIEKTIHSVAAERVRSMLPLTQSGGYSKEELQKDVATLYGSFFPDVPYWSPRKPELSIP